MRAFVTGGTGFVGANLVASLNESGIVPRVLVRPSSSQKALAGLQYEAYFGDILGDVHHLKEAMSGCDWIFHAAAVSDYWRQSKEVLYRVNVEGTQRVLEAAQASRVKRFVYTSSISALGFPADGQFLDESSEFDLNPKTWPYAHSKALAEVRVFQATEEGLPALVVNLPGILGPRDVNMISGSIIVEAYRGLLRVYPPGGSNFASVEDVATGHILAAQRGRVGERYILGGENFSYKEIALKVCEVVGRPAPRLALPRWSLPFIAAGTNVARFVLGNRIPFNAQHVRLSGIKMFVNGEKAFKELQHPKSPFETAVQKTFDWYNENGYLD